MVSSAYRAAAARLYRRNHDWLQKAKRDEILAWLERIGTVDGHRYEETAEALEQLLVHKGLLHYA